MCKKFLALLVVFIMVFATAPAFAAQRPVIYSDTITVTNHGGIFQVGFVTLEFKKDFLEKDKLPATFKVEVDAIDGVAGVEINPETPKFNKNVHIKVEQYKGLLYDKSSGKNISVRVRSQEIIAEHFSRYAFR